MKNYLILFNILVVRKVTGLGISQISMLIADFAVFILVVAFEVKFLVRLPVFD